MPCSRSGVTASETRAGPITACTPGSLAIFRCQRLSASSRSGSVIGPFSVAATTTKGDSKPGPTERAISSLSARAGLLSSSCSGLGGPVFSASAGPARSRTTAPIAIADRRRAAQRGGDHRHQAASARRRRAADPPAVEVGAEQGEQRGAGDRRDEDAEHDDEGDGRRQRGEQRAGDDEEGDQHREQQGAAGERRRPPGGPPGRRPPPPSARSRSPALRGSARPSAGRSRPRAPGPSSCRR